MMIDPDIRRQLRTKWIRHQGKIGNMIQDMERELDKLRDKKISEAFIDEKSQRMDVMIEAVNYADELITILSNENTMLRIQLTITESEMVKEANSNIESLRKFLDIKDTPHQVKQIVDEIK